MEVGRGRAGREGRVSRAVIPKQDAARARRVTNPAPRDADWQNIVSRRRAPPYYAHSRLPPIMDQLEEYVTHAAQHLTAEEVEEAVRAVPMVKAEAALVEMPRGFPQLPAQVELLCQFIEDVHGGHVSREDAGPAYLEAAFAVRYFHRKVDVIPDHIPGIGKLDDAVVVQSVLRRNEAIFQAYADQHDLPWGELKSLM